MSDALKAPPALPWTDRFRVGVEALDEDHRALVRQINDICAAWEGGETQRAQEGLDALCALAAAHFSREEEILRGLRGYRNVTSHAAEHENRLAQLTALRDRLGDPGACCGDVQLRAGLVDWFVRQSIDHDAEIKAYFDDGRPSDSLSGKSR